MKLFLQLKDIGKAVIIFSALCTFEFTHIFAIYIYPGYTEVEIPSKLCPINLTAGSLEIPSK